MAFYGLEWIHLSFVIRFSSIVENVTNHLSFVFDHVHILCFSVGYIHIL